jgi:hypothetical protein
VTVTFKDWNDVKSSPNGVSIIRQVPTPVTTLSPSMLRPTSASGVSWSILTTGSNIPGGPNITYVVQCKGDHLTSKTPPFHLLSDAWLDFDTNPGG